MNGRTYDPELGRFMGVDPFMQAPLNSQSLNPYSYVMNNPLAGTDPTGYTSECVGADKAACDKKKFSFQGFLESRGLGWATGGNGKESGSKSTIEQGVDLLNLSKRLERAENRFLKKLGAIVEVREVKVDENNNAKAGTEGKGAGDRGNGGAGSTSALTLGVLLGAAVLEGSKDLLVAAGGLVATGAVMIGGALVPQNTIASDDVEQAHKDAALKRLTEATAALQKAREADGKVTLYHGTDVKSALALLNGAPLSVELATKLKYQSEVGLSEVGFYLTDNIDAAAMFAARRHGDATILAFTFDQSALTSVLVAGAIVQPMPPGKLRQDPGMELIVLPTAFPTFDAQRESGGIVVTPARY